MAKKVNLFFIALPYVTAKLHIGRIMGTFLPADIYKRFLSLKYNRKTLLLSGLDCYGTAVYQEVLNSNTSYKKYLSKKESEFYSTLSLLNVNLSRKFKTASIAHKKFVNFIFEQLKAESRLKSKKIEELYCCNCKLALCERFLIDASGRNYESIAEEQRLLKTEEIAVNESNSYCVFCKQKPIKKIFNALFLTYEHSALKNELFLKKFNLKETEKQISRAFLNWGLPASKDLINFNENEPFTYYVWIEALISYFEMYSRLKLNNNEIDIIRYFYGKDNDYYHRVIYPNLIPYGKIKNYKLNNLKRLAINKPLNLEILKTSSENVIKRNYVINENREKLSSSKQNFITLDDFKIVNKDLLRFGLSAFDCLMSDSVISVEKILHMCDLYLKKFVNNYNRVIGYLRKNNVFLNLETSLKNNELLFDVKNYEIYMLQNNLKLAIEELFKFQHLISKEVDLKIRNKDRNWQQIFNSCVTLNELLLPFTPKASGLIRKALRKKKPIKFNKDTYELKL